MDFSSLARETPWNAPTNIRELLGKEFDSIDLQLDFRLKILDLTSWTENPQETSPILTSTLQLLKYSRRPELTRLLKGLAEGIAKGLAKGKAEGLANGTERGIVIGRIQLLQQLLGLGISSKEELMQMKLPQVHDLATSLEQRLKDKSI